MPEEVAIIHAAMAEISTRQQNADIQTDGRLIVDKVQSNNNSHTSMCLNQESHA